jgi:hypothetical protein
MKFRLIILLILLVSLSSSGCLEVVNPKSPEEIQTFDILIKTSGSCFLKDKNITVLVRVNGTELVGWTNPGISFIAKPTPKEGTTKDDYETLYFSAENFDTQLFKFNGAYQIKWLIDNRSLFYVSGSKTMSYMKDYNITLSFNFNIFELTKISTSNLTLSLRNKDNTWSDRYNVKFVVVNG